MPPDDVQPYTTWPGLANAWALRDDLYSRASKPLTEEAIEAIRLGRKQESNRLERPGNRAYAWAMAATWWPPEHGQ